MKNIRKEKYNKLKGVELLQQSLKAIEWLDNNRSMFKGVVYEPMFLLVSNCNIIL